MNDLLFQDEFQPVLASRMARVLAIGIDYAINIAFFVLIAYHCGTKTTQENGGISLHVEGTPALVCMLFWFVTFPILESLAGQTAGKMALGIKVIRPDGTKASLGNTLVRHLFDVIDYLPFFGIVGLIVASRNKLGQRVGDLVAKTMVVKK